MNSQERAESAKRFLTDEAVIDAFNKVRDAYVQTAMKCAKTDDRGRYLTIEAARIVDLVHAQLAKAIKTGELEAKEAQAVTGLEHIWADGISRAKRRAVNEVNNY